MRVLIFGSRGYLGRKFRDLYQGAICPDVDIADTTCVCEVLDESRPDVCINAAGKTGVPNVDWCEDHKEETLRSNVTGPLVLLDACGKRKITLVHLGSGCIYEGDQGGRGFTESDPPNFMGSYYARTKAWADQILKEFPGVLVLRLRMPFDGSTHPRNLISKLRQYTRVLDAPNSLTYLPDFLEATKVLIERRREGAWNIVNPGTISPYEIMQLYKKIVQPEHAFTRLSLEELHEVARAGRSNCVLSGGKLQAEGISMRPVELAVEEALHTLKRELGTV